jgi:hypothetical protein
MKFSMFKKPPSATPHRRMGSPLGAMNFSARIESREDAMAHLGATARAGASFVRW